MNCKTCSKCKIEKPLSEFGKRNASKDGLRSHCKKCDTLCREQNKDKIKQYVAVYQEQNKDKIRERSALHYQKKISEQPACIYQILNKQNGKVYIGQTIRGELRWKDHLSSLRGQRHENKKLQQDFNLFGEEAFEWEILFELPKDEKILLLEEALTITDMIKNGFELYNEAITIEQLALINENETMETK